MNKPDWSLHQQEGHAFERMGCSDRILSRHYGSKDEDLDFIINYDIKYRMGQDAEESDEP